MKVKLLLPAMLLMALSTSVLSQTLTPNISGIIYVTPTASGSGTGDSWGNATNKLREAILTAGVEQVWVAAGTYTPADDGNREKSFEMVNNVAIYGGFAGTETDLAQRDRTINETILSGDLNGDDDGGGDNSENSYHVIYNNDLDATAILDGFIITGGNAVGSGEFQLGGGMFNSASSPTLKHVSIHGNRASQGGGIFNGNSSAPTLTNVVISENMSVTRGGAMLNDGFSSPILLNVTIVKNTTGAAESYVIHNFDPNSKPKVYNSIILGNNSGIADFGCADELDASSSNNLIQVGDETSVATFDCTPLNEMTPPTPTDVFVDFENGDYRLRINEYVVDAGDKSLYAQIGDIDNDSDFGGDPRLYGVNIDLGAYEFQGIQITPSDDNVLFVKKGSWGGDGSSWADALGEVRDALTWAKDNQSTFTTNPLQIWVAAGTYTPTDDGNRARYFQMVNNVAIYGGFAGTETDLSQRDWEAYPTILSGDLNDDDGVLFPNIDENSYHVFYHYNNHLDATAVLDGFTITGGNASGSINLSWSFQGGGMFNYMSSPSLTNIIISGNKALTSGGGMYNNASSPTITRVSIDGNSAKLGGGMYNLASSPILTHVNLTENEVGLDGGGMYNESSSPFLKNTSIRGNASLRTGGGMYNESSTPTLVNVIIGENTANDGAGLANDGSASSPVLVNVTIAGNSASIGAGGMMNSDNSQPKVYNSIILGNSSGNLGELDGSSSNNLIQTDDAASGGSADGTGTAIANTIPTDIFTDFASGDYTLKAGTYSVDAGDNSIYENTTGRMLGTAEIDLFGNPRLFGTNIDLGAYELQDIVIQPAANNIVYVKKGAAGDGSSWTNALGEVRDALTWAKANNSTPLQIWVAAGTYTPTVANGDRTISFGMANNVAIYGGFSGGETTLAQRDWRANKTILSGDLNGDDGADFSNNRENSNHVFYNNGILDATAILDGVVISGGNANVGSSISGSGGGMYNVYSFSPTLTNVTISGNTAKYYGGGIYNYNHSSPSLTNVTISGNTANNSGGGMYNEFSSSPILTNVIISDNTAKNYGGGIDNTNSSLTLTNVTIVGNTANITGGGIDNYGSSTLKVYNAIILGNSFGIRNVGGGTLDHSSSNNLIQTDDAASGGSADGTGTAIANTTSADIFTDFANGDYTLKAGSYAVDAGDNDLYNLVGDVDNDEDLAGNERLAGKSIDLGALEFDSRPLPIQLISFAAVSSGGNALLQWSTATESNNKGFYIEHSTDGSHWQDKAFVATRAQQGNSQSLLTYNYTDINPGRGQHFYRLRQVDLDGAFNYSDVKVVVFDNRSDITVYPNPVRSSVTISGLGDGTYKLSLLNSAGQVLQQHKVQSQSQFRMDMSRLASGVYYIQIVDEQGKMESKKVVKE